MKHVLGAIPFVLFLLLVVASVAGYSAMRQKTFGSRNPLGMMFFRANETATALRFGIGMAFFLLFIGVAVVRGGK